VAFLPVHFPEEHQDLSRPLASCRSAVLANRTTDERGALGSGKTSSRPNLILRQAEARARWSSSLPPDPATIACTP
jgi:hypothetical protein